MTVLMPSAAAPQPAADEPPAQRKLSTRLRAPMPDDRWFGWLAPAAIAFLAGALRFWNLKDPHAFVFDETYYAKDAWSLLEHGHERAFVENANDLILNGTTDSASIFGPDASFIAHPPAGKWVIAAGEWMFQFDPFGWRFMVALLGTLSVLMIGRIARRLFRSTQLGCIAAVLLALDGMHFVHSRTTLLDLILMFFALAAFGCLLIDRDWSRARLERTMDRRIAAEPPGLNPDLASKRAAGLLGPRAGWRPLRLAAGLLLGLACATKWSGIPFVAVFGLMLVAWDMGARRRLGARLPFLGMLSRDALPGFLAIVGGAFVAYVASWSGWLFTDNGYNRDKVDDFSGLASVLARLPDKFNALAALADYHAQMWNFNSQLSDPHPYSSNPWSWLILGRPVSFFYEGPKLGEEGCKAAEGCSQAVLAVGTPLIWWTGILAILAVAFCWLLNRDWRAGAVLSGLVAGYLPWFLFQERTIYSFYAIVFLPWIVLALTYCAGLLIRDTSAPVLRRRWGIAAVQVFLLAVLANFVLLYPVFANRVIPYTWWSELMWFDSWI